jgi:signal transduction histidine kinase
MMRLRSLYWRIAILFLGILAVIGGVHVVVAINAADTFLRETTQRVYAGMGKELVEYLRSMGGVEITDESIAMVVRRAQSINPGTDVYFLDPSGTIMASSVPAGAIARPTVAMDPVAAFLGGAPLPVLGDDPRSPDGSAVFTSAPLADDRRLHGYVYVVLLGKNYTDAAGDQRARYLFMLGLRTIPITLAAAGIVALILLWLLTRRLRNVMEAVRSFEAGNLQSRVHIRSHDEIGELGTALNSMADTIVGNMDDIKRTDEMRRELIANISHDLKTPLSSLRGYVDTLLLKNDLLSTAERQQYLEVVSRSITGLVELIDQLLELSRLDARQTEPRPEPFPIQELVSDVMQSFKPQADALKIRLRTIVHDQLPLVIADIRLIERALQNLVGNALRYTPEIGVVTVELSKHDGGVQVEVADTGEGIPEGDLPHIFDRFYRAEKSRSRASGGTGLGLAITRKILELHGSGITVRSTLHAGTTFSFILPTSAGA